MFAKKNESFLKKTFMFNKRNSKLLILIPTYYIIHYKTKYCYLNYILIEDKLIENE